VKLKGSTTQTNWQKKPPKVKNVNLGPNRTRFGSHGTPKLRCPVRMSRRHLLYLKHKLTTSGVWYRLIMYHSSNNSKHLVFHIPNYTSNMMTWVCPRMIYRQNPPVLIMMFFFFLDLCVCHIPQSQTK